jgi:hypothetical protein
MLTIFVGGEHNFLPASLWIGSLMQYQGNSLSTRWQWNATVGNLIDRPGRMGDWGYVNTESVPFS